MPVATQSTESTVTCHEQLCGRSSLSRLISQFPFICETLLVPKASIYFTFLQFSFEKWKTQCLLYRILSHSTKVVMEPQYLLTQQTKFVALYNSNLIHMFCDHIFCSFIAKWLQVFTCCPTGYLPYPSRN